MKLQDEALLYLRDNITKDEAYYILPTENEMTEVLMFKRKDGSKRIKILDAEYTIEKDDMLFLLDTDGVIEWKSDGYIEVGGVQVWAYYYFEDGEDVDRCDWADHMEIEVEECWI